MEEYESVMKLNVVRPVTVTNVSRTAMGTFLVETDCLLGGTPARWEARTVVSGEIHGSDFAGEYGTAVVAPPSVVPAE